MTGTHTRLAGGLAALEAWPDTDPSTLIAGYRLAATCPQCGGGLAHEATGTPGADTRAVVRCEPCRRHWVIVVQLRDATADVGRPVGAGEPHGTRTQYVRGCRCGRCTDAERLYRAEYRHRHPQSPGVPA